MRMILLGIAAATVLSLVSAGLLISTEQYAYEAYSTTGARVSDPGHNLVGPKWTGAAQQRS